MVWNDQGTGGKKGSFWIINDMQMLAVTQGHQAPNIDNFYEFPKKKFRVSEYEKVA